MAKVDPRIRPRPIMGGKYFIHYPLYGLEIRHDGTMVHTTVYADGSRVERIEMPEPDDD